MRPKPYLPDLTDLYRYQSEHQCGLAEAKRAMTEKYQPDMIDWLVDAVELLLAREGL